MQKRILFLLFFLAQSFCSVFNFKPCTPNCKCVYGQCISQSECNNNQDCQVSNICSQGKCIKKSDQYECNQDNDCRPTQKCRKGKCLIDQVQIFSQHHKDKCAKVKCSSGFICQNGICVKDPTIISTCPADAKYKTTLCNDPRPDDKTCPVINYIKKPDPLFCGVKADGTKIDFITQCQVCKNPEIFQFFNSSCLHTPSICSPNQLCQNSSCINKSCEKCNQYQFCNQQGLCIDRCTLINCKFGTICQKGQCIKDVNFIQTCPLESLNQHYTVCTEPRPNDQNCPIIFYVRAPDPLFCGVQADGTRIDFPRDCQACYDASILYYFHYPCQEAAVVCKKTQKCNQQNGICEPITSH